MTKERWNVVRNLEEIPMDVWFDYYKEKGGKSNSIEEFSKAFAGLGRTTFMINSDQKYVQVNFDTAIKKINEHYNNKFKD